MSVRILQFGTTGQVASELLRQAPRHDVTIDALSRADCDLMDPELVARILWSRPAYDLIVIAAAYTAVDKAETELEAAFQVNAEAVAAIAAARGGANGPEPSPAIVWFSTDYVFDGEKGAPYLETDETHPLSAYGRTKEHGEFLLRSTCARSLILRTSWLVSAHGKNFVKTMLRLAREGAPLRVVDDQFGRPTSAADLADFVLANAALLAAAPEGDPHFGTFHFANAGETSWKRFAEAILQDAMGDQAPPVEPIATAERPSPAQRPMRGTLDTGKLERVYGYTPRPWREALAEIVAELESQEVSA